jgi:glycosyltransferase involved in cell wall biosynthesis
MDVMYLLPETVLPKSPSIYQRLGREYLRRLVPRSVTHAAAIITISFASRNDIVKHLNVPKHRIHVVSLAANSACRTLSDVSVLDAVRAKYGLDRRFVLALGAVDPRKNTARIIEAYAKFRRRVSEHFQLLIVGIAPSAQTAFRAMVEKLGLGNDAAFFEFVPENDLVALYNAAEMLVYPSLYEGFGLPVLEAMACGTPVIASARGSIPEVAGEAALMVNPLDIDEIATAMTELITNTKLRHSLVAEGKAQAAKFSWQRMAEQIFEIYKNVRA